MHRFYCFSPYTKGYDLLKFLNNQELVNDSLTNDIISYYSKLENVLREYNKASYIINKVPVSVESPGNLNGWLLDVGYKLPLKLINRELILSRK